MLRKTRAVIEGSLAAAIDAGAWSEVNPDLDTLADATIEMLIEGHDSDLIEFAGVAQRLYGHLLDKHDVEERLDAGWVAAELRAFNRLLGVAARHRRAPVAQKVADLQTLLPVLKALLGHPAGRSGRELADALGWAPETIARRLPMLRAAGLVRSWKVGREVLNTLTPSGHRTAGVQESGSARVLQPADRPRTQGLAELTRAFSYKAFNVLDSPNILDCSSNIAPLHSSERQQINAEPGIEIGVSTELASVARQSPSLPVADTNMLKEWNVLLREWNLIPTEAAVIPEKQSPRSPVGEISLFATRDVAIEKQNFRSN